MYKRQAYDSGVAELASQRASAEAQLAEAERQLADGRAQTDAARPAIEQLSLIHI